MKSFRTTQNDERRLAQMRAKVRDKRADGQRYVEGESNTIMRCPKCSAPVVANANGIRGHMQRIPGCRAAMEALLV